MGKERLASPGYYLTYFGPKNCSVFSDTQDLQGEQAFGVVYISPEGKCQYIHWDWGSEWSTLTWTCAPTKKQIENEEKFSDQTQAERYLYFATHQELLNFPHLHHKPAAMYPAPIDMSQSQISSGN